MALSALLTTTMPFMKSTIEELKKAGVREQVKVMIGGAPGDSAVRRSDRSRRLQRQRERRRGHREEAREWIGLRPVSRFVGIPAGSRREGRPGSSR